VLATEIPARAVRLLIAKLANKLEVIERFDIAIEPSPHFPAIAGH
jgi:hypothetical protein